MGKNEITAHDSVSYNMPFTLFWIPDFYIMTALLLMRIAGMNDVIDLAKLEPDPP
jgi:hypothetical protein